MSKFVSLGFRGDSPWRIPLHCGALLIILAALLGVGAPAARAQSYVQNSGLPTFTTALPVEHGIVNLASGQVHLEIPLGSYPQRGGGQDKAAWYYDSGIWAPVYGTWQYQPATHFNTSVFLGGWGLRSMVDSGISDTESYQVCSKDGNTEQQTISSFLWVSGDGTVRSFPTVSVSDGFTTACGTGKTQLSSDGYAGDGSGYHFYVTAGVTFSVTNIDVYAPDGTIVYRWPNLSGNWDLLWDTNGNHYYTGPTENQDLDTVGRPIPQMTSSGNAPSNITIWYALQNSQGGTDTYTTTGVEINVSTKFGVSGLTEYSGVMYVMQSMQMPDGTSYSFKYDCDSSSGNSACGSPAGQSAYYGLLTSMSLPTGGTINYTYQMFKDADGNPYTRINSRKTQDGTWTYTASVITSPTCSSTQVNCQQKVTVTKPSGDQAIYTFTLNGGAWPTEVQYYNGAVSSANLVDTSTQCFSFVTVTNGQCSYTVQTASSALNVTKTASTMTLPNGENTTTEYAYDGYGNVTQVSEWNFYSGALPTAADRTTTTTYLTTSSYINAHILNRPTSVIVKNNTGTILAQTTYSYDQYALTSVTGVVNHDDTNYGTGNNIRGNLTQMSQWLNTNNSWLTTNNYYNTVGNLIKTTDPKGNTTTFSYADNYYNYSPSAPTSANVTQITRPSTNGVNHIDHAQYYFGTGQPSAVCGENFSSTCAYGLVALQPDYASFAYDSMNRATTVNSGDGGQATATYGTTAPINNTVNTKIDNTHTLATTTVLDVLGRTSQTQTSSPQGTIYVNTAYDSNGRAHTESNPHYSSSSATDGTATSSYDGLDRVIKVTEQDSSTSNTYYGATVGSNGGQTSQLCSGSLMYPILYVNETSNKRQTWTDAFGRITETDEPDSNNNLTIGTCYSYDANNNLTQVVKGTETRTYSYDTLSRLTTKADPESGTSYFYYTTSAGALCSADPSAVCRRTDARGITTTYLYDALNRPTSKSYSDTTPTANFVYDACPTEGCPTGVSPQYPIGRMVKAYTSSAQTFYSYDPMGRYAEQWQCTPVDCATGLLPFLYTHNYLGQQTSINYYGFMTLSQTYDNAARLNQLTSTLSDQYDPPTLVTVSQFSPIGLPSQISYGNGLAETRSYNNRLQPTQLRVYLPPSTDVLNQTFTWTNSSSKNNENLWGWAASGSGTPTFNRTYTYDNLNRLATMSSPADPSGCTGLSWTIDALGNRNDQNVTGGTCSAPQLTVNTKNQISNPGIGYDVDGNLNQIGSPFQYDAENRLVNVNNGGAIYVYDANGRRIEKIISTAQNHYFYDEDGHVVLEVNQNGQGTKAYEYMAGQHVAEYLGQTYFIHTDHLGSTRTVTNYAGSVVDAMDYLPYGEQIAGGTSTTHKFTGYERDAETGIDYASARYYASGLGRFMSPDPTGIFLGNVTDPQQLNLYSYGRNNPLTVIDPTGMDSCPGLVCTVSFGGGSGGSGVGGGGFYSGPYIGQGGFGGVVGGGASVGGLPSNAPNGTVYDPWGVPVCVFNNGVCGAPIYPASHTPLSAAAAPTCGLFNCPEPKGPPPQPAQPSWWGTFFSSLLSPGEDVTTIYHSFADAKGCDRLLAGTFFGDLLPIPSDSPGLRDATESAQGVAYAAGMARAVGYSTRRGLIQPMSSSIYRSLKGTAIEYSEAAAEIAPEALVLGSAAHALGNQISGAINGTCH